MSLSRFLSRLRKRILNRRTPTKARSTGKLRVTRLEERQLLDAGFGITAAGILQMDGFDMGDALIIESGPALDSLQFELAQGNWFADPASPHILSGRALISDGGRTLTIDNSQAQLTPITAINIDSQALQPTLGVVTPLTGELASISSLNEFVVSDLVITGGGVVSLTGADFDTLSVDASSLDITDSDELELGDLSLTGTLTVTAGGDITDADGATIDVGGNASFTGASILLGDHTTDDLDFGSVQFSSSGDVDITEADSMHLVGNNSAASAILQATGNIDVDTDTTVRSEGGRVSLEAGAEGTLRLSGTIDVSDTDAAQVGGRVELLGKNVGLFEDARIDASGDAGGGTVLIGGDYQGGNPAIHNADATYFSADASVSADAITAGDGGTVIVWADNSTKFYGTILARGGPEGGDGGFVETSGKDYLEVIGATVDASAAHGAAGNWLLDSHDVILTTDLTSGGGFVGVEPNVFTPTGDPANADINTIQSSLNDGTSVTINTGSDGTITVKDTITVSTPAGATLLLTSGSTITVDAAITASGSALNVVFTTTNDLVDINANITTNGGNFTVNNAAAFDVADVDISVGGGSINIQADTMTIAANTGDNVFAGTSSLTLRPTTTSRTIGLGDASMGAFHLDATEIGEFADGFSSIIIGDVTSGTGTVDINTATFLNPVTIAGGTINDGAGTDVTAPSVTLDGTVSPGQSPGVLNVAGNFAFADDDTFKVEIGGTTAGTADDHHDQINVTGTVTIGSNVTLDLTSLNAYAPVAGDTFVLINNVPAGAVTGTFATLSAGGTDANGGTLEEGDLITNFLGTGFVAAISYQGDSGNDVVIIVNAAPTVSVGDLGYTEDQNAGSPVQIDSAATANDANGDTDWDGGSLTVQITANGEAADEISITGVDGITISGANVQTGGSTTFGTIVETSGTDDDGIVTSGDLLTINFNANATNALVQNLVRSVAFRSTSDDPGTSDRTVTFTVTDTNTGSESDASTISMTSVNDAPTLTTFADAVDSTNEDTEVELTFAELKAQGNEADADGTVEGFVVQAVSSGTLKIGVSSGAASAFAAGTIDVIDSTNKAFWTPDSDVNGSNVAAFTVLAEDNESVNSITAITVNVDVAAVNDPPTMANLDGDSFTYTEGDAATAIDQGGNATLADIDSTDFSGGNLTVTITSGEDSAEDILAFDTGGTVALAGTTAGSNVSVGGNVVGTLGNDITAGNDLVVNFDSVNATADTVEVLVRAITYQNTDTFVPTTGARNVRVTVSDGGISSNADVTVTVEGAAENTVTLSSGNLVIGNSGTAVNNNFTLSFDGTYITINDTVDTLDVTGVAGASGSGTNTVTIPLSSITQISVNGEGGDDSLTLDFSSGDFLYANGLTLSYDGGGQTTSPGGDSITVSGGSFGSIAYNVTGNGAGNFEFNDKQSILFEDLEPATITSLAGTTTINIDDGVVGGSLSYELTDGGDSADGMLFLDLPGGLEDLTFAVPSVELIINGDVDSNDFITTSSVDDGTAPKITIDGRGGTDSVTLDTAFNLGSNDLSITAETIAQNAGDTITTSGTATFDAGLSGTVTLNEANDFGTIVVTNANTASITDANSVIIGAISTSNSFALNVASGNSTQAAATTIGGTGSLTKEGAGTLTLNAANTFTGATEVNTGTLLVNGSRAADSAVTVASGATLGGTGTVGGSVTVASGGTITGGDIGTVGTLTVGSLSLDDSTYHADVNGDTSDTIVSGGTIDLQDSVQGFLALNVLGGTTTAGTSFTLIKNTHPSNALVNPPLSSGTGTIAEGDSATVNGRTALYSYIGGTGGNDLTLSTVGAASFSGTINADDITLQRVTIGGVDYLQLVMAGAIFEQRLLSTLTEVTINGGDGNDILTIDYGTGGFFDVDINFHGGDPTTGSGDGILVIGNGGLNATYTPDAATTGNGTVSVDDGANTSTVTFTGLEPVDITGFASATLALPGASDLLTVANGTDFFSGGTTAALRVSGTSGGVAIETAAFYNNTLMTIDTSAVDGVDVINISSAFNDHNNINVVITTGSGADAINVNGNVLTEGNLTLTSAAINLNADIGTDGAAAAGDVLLNGTIVLGANVEVDTDGTGSDGTATFNGTVNSDGTTRSLTVTGNGTFASIVGASSVLNILSVTGNAVLGGNVSASTVDLNDADGVVITANTELDAAIIDVESGITGAFTLTLDGSTSVDVNGTISTTNLTTQTTATTNGVDITGSLNASGGNLTTDVGAIQVAGNVTTTAVDLISATFIDVDGSAIVGGDLTGQGGSVLLGANAADDVTLTASALLTATAMVEISGGISGAFNVNFAGATGNDVAETIGVEVIDVDVTAGNLVAGTIDITGNLTNGIGLNVETDVGAVNVDGNLTTGGTLIAETGVDIGGNSSLGGNVTAQNANVSFVGSVTLTADSIVDTSANDGNVTFTANVLGNQLLTVAAGMGTVNFLSTVGTTTTLSGLLLNSAGTLKFDNTVAVDDQGLDITAGMVTVDSTVTSTNGGNVEITNNGLLTIAAAGDLSLDGSFTQDGTGSVSTAGDILTTNDDISFATAVTLTGNVDIDTTGAIGGNIVFTSTIATGANNLALDAGPVGNLTLSNDVSGGGDLTVRDAAILAFDGVSVDSIDVLDATTSVTFNDAVIVTANNASGGNALKVNTPGVVTIGGSITATAATSLNIDIDPTEVNTNANMTATGNINIVANNNVTVATGITVRADSDAVGGGTLNVTADLDNSGAGTLLSNAGSLLQGHTVNIAGFDITVDDVTADTGDVTANAQNNLTLNGPVTATTAQIIGVATVGDLTINANLSAGTNVDLDAQAGTISHTTGNKFAAGGSVALDAATAIDIDGTIGAGTAIGGDINIGTNINSPNVTVDGNITGAAAVTFGGANLTGSVAIGTTSGATTISAADAVVIRADGTITQADGGNILSTGDNVTIQSDTGNIEIGSLTATVGDIFVTALTGSINDSGDDANVDVTAGGAITLTAQDEIGGMPTPGTATDTSGALEVAAGSNVTASSTVAGSIVLRSLGAITLSDIDTADGSITVVAAGLVTATDVAAAGTGGNVNLSTTAAGISTTTVSTVDGDVALTADNGNVTVGAGSVTAGGSGQDITITTSTSGDVALTGTTTATDDTVTINSAGTINGAGLVTADTADLDAVSGIGNTTAVQLAADNVSADVTSGNIDIDNALAAAVNVSSLTTVGATINFDQTGSGAVTFSGPVSSGNGTTDGGNISLTSASGLTVDGVVSSAAGAGGTLSVSGATINATPIVGAGNISIAGGSVDTVIAAAMAGAGDLQLTALRDVLIRAHVSTTAGGNITVTADTDGVANIDTSGMALGGVFIATDGQLNSDGTATVTGSDLLNLGAAKTTTESIQVDADGAMNQIVAVGNITLQSGGTAPATADIVINGRVTSTTGDVDVTAPDDITTATTIEATAGSIDFNSYVVLTDGTSIVAGTNATFDGMVDGAFDLITNVDGSATFVGSVGGTTAIGDGTGAAITITGDGTTEFQSTVGTASGVTQANNSGAVTFRNDITAAAGNTGSTFNGDVVMDGLTFTSGGNVVFGNANSDKLTTSTAPVTLNTSTAGANVTMHAATTANADLTVAVGNGDITVNARINGNSNIVFNSAGTTDINAAVGNSTAVASLTTDAPGTTQLSADVTAQGGTITINDPLVLNTDVVMTDSGTTGIFLNNVVDSDGTTRDLTLTTTNAASAVQLNGAVGTTSALDELKVNAAGSLLQAGNIGAAAVGAASVKYDAVGAIKITGSSNVRGNIDIDSMSTIVISNTITTTTNGTVSIDADGLTTLTADADIAADGAVTFGAARSGGLSTAGAITTTNDNITFHQAVTLTGTVNLDTDTGAGDVTFAATNGTVDGTSDLTIAAGTGNVEFDAVIGGTTSLDDIIVTSANAINFDAAITAATVTANGTTIDGSGLVTAGIVNLDAVNGIGATTSLELAATNISADTTSGNIDIDNVSTADVTVTSLTTGTGSIAFDQSGGGNASFGTLSATANIEICMTAGMITLTNNVSATAVRLQTGGGNVTQSGGSIAATDLGVRATTGIGLTQNTNDVTTFAAATTSGDITFNEANGFTVNTVTAGSCFAATTGVTTPGNGNITLNAVTGTMTIDEDVTTVGGNIDIDAATSVVVNTPAAGILDISTNGSGTINIDAGLTVQMNGTAAVPVNVTTVDGAITINGTGTIAATAGSTAGIELINTTIQTTTGAIILTGTGGDDASGNNDGIEVSVGTIQSISGIITLMGTGGFGGNSEGVEFEDSNVTSSGNIFVMGLGGADAIGMGFNSGVDLDNDTTVSTTGSGTVTLNGTGGALGDDAAGIQIQGGSSVSAVNGSLLITGRGGAGGDFNAGVWIDDGQVETTGVGTLTLHGTGGAAAALIGKNIGVQIQNSSTVSAANGNMLVTGVGGADGDRNLGILIEFSTVESIATATVTLNGTGGVTGDSNAGLFMLTGTIASTSGDVSVTGVGGINGADNNAGVALFGNAMVESLGAAKISVKGTGGGTGEFNDGIYVAFDSAITSVDGALTVLGTGGGSAAGDDNVGVYIDAGGSIASTGAATIDVDGDGTAGTTDRGVVVAGVNSSINSVSAAIDIEGTSTSSYGIEITDSAAIVSNTGNINIAGQGGSAAIGGRAGIVIDTNGIVQSTGSSTITLLGTGNMAADGVRVGSAAGAGMVESVDGSISISGTAGTGNAISLLFNSNVTGTGNAAITMDGTGDIFMADGTNVTAANASDIDVTATTDITISAISSVGGEVEIISTTGAIIDGGETDVDVVAASVALHAATGIGSALPLSTLETTVDILAFNNSTAGDVLISNSTNLIVGAAGTLTASANSGGDAKLTVIGNLDIDEDLSVETKNLLLNVTGNVTQQADDNITAAGLALMVTGATTLSNLGNNIVTLAADTDGQIVYQDADAIEVGSVTVDGMTVIGIDSNSSDVTLCATSITLATTLATGTGTLRLSASTGGINQTGGMVTAQNLGARASTGISLPDPNNNVVTLAADGGIGDVTFVDTDGFTVATVADGDCFTAVAGVTTAGNITLTANAGTLQTDDLVSSTSGGIDLTGDSILQNADIQTGGAGTIDIAAGNGSVTQSDGVTIRAGSGLISLDASADIAVSMIISTSGDARLTADSDNDNVGAITDNLTGETPNITADELALRSGSGIGSADDVNTAVRRLTAETESGNILISNDRAAGLEIGSFDGLSGVTITDATDNNAGDSILIQSSGSLHINDAIVNNDEGHVTLKAIGDFNADETIQTGGTGTVYVGSATGSINVTDTDNTSDGIVTEDGDILTETAVGDISLADNVTSTSGDIGINATGTATLVGDATSGASILSSSDVIVSAATIAMDENTEIRNTGAGGNNISLQSTSGDITLESIVAGNGLVRIDSAEDILDRDGGETTNIMADGVQLTAVGFIGGPDLANADVDENTSAINTEINTLSASAGSGIYVREADTLIIGAATPSATISVLAMSVNTDGSTTTESLTNAQTPISGLATTGGPIKIVTAIGELRIQSAITVGSADVVLLETRDAMGADVVIEVAVSTQGGHITVISTDDIQQAATGNIVSNGGDIFLQAQNTDGIGTGLSMTAGTSITTDGGDIRLEALGTETDISLLSIDAGTGSIDIEATGSILDGMLAGTNLTGNALRMIADSGNDGLGSIGSAGGTTSSNNIQAINTNVATVGAKAAEGIYIEQTGQNVAVDDVSVSVTRTHFSSNDTTRTESLQDLETTNNGPVKIINNGGDITINDGSDADDAGIVAHGTGDVLLETRGAGAGSIDVQTDVHSTSGHVTIWSATDVTIGNTSTVSTGSTGSIVTEAVAGNVTMAQAGTFETVDGDIHARANGNVTVGRINSAANVAVTSVTGFIHDADADDATVDITAEGLRINAAIEVGETGATANAIGTTITTLTARAGSGGVNILETDALRVGEVEVNTNRAQFDSLTTTIQDALQSDIVTTADGNIVLRATDGDITLVDGSATADGGDDNTAIRADGDGNILIAAEGAGRNIQANEDIVSGTGDITLTADANVVVDDDISTGGDGTVFVQAANGFITLNEGTDADATGITTANGDIHLAAATDATLNADINSINGNVGVSAGNDILQNGDITTTTGSVLLNAVRDITMDGMKSVAATMGNILLKAGRAIGLGLLDGTNIGLDGGTDIVDNNAGGTSNVRATNLRAIAGGTIGTGGGTTSATNNTAIDIDVTNVAAQAGTGIYLQSTNTTTLFVNHIDAATVEIDVNQVLKDATVTGIDFDNTQAALDDLTTTNNGPLKVVASSITANDGTDGDGIAVRANGTGDVLLAALTGDVVINADISSVTGHVTITAGNGVDQNADVATTGAGTILIVATAADIDMDETLPATTTSGGGNILLEATAGNISVATIDAGSGDVSLQAGTDIVDGDTSATLNIMADALRMQAGGTIGSGDGTSGVTANTLAIDTQVNTLAAISANGIYMLESDGLSVDNTTAITVRQVEFDSGLVDVTENSLSDLVTTAAGAIKLVSMTGNITINEGDADDSGVAAATTGDVLLEARGNGSDVVVNADVNSGSGHITIAANDDIAVSADITAGGAATGTVLLNAGNNSVEGVGTDGIVMATGTTITSGGDMSLIAGNESDIVVELLVAADNTVSLSAARDILDGNGAALNVVADSLMMIADSNGNQAGIIGGPDTPGGATSNSNAMDTQVATLATSSADGIFVNETDGDLTIDTVSFTVQRSNFNSTLSPETGALSDLTTTDAATGAPIKVVNSDGTITVNDGLPGNGRGISAAGDGDVLLKAENAGDLILDADIASGAGHITLSAATQLQIGTGANTDVQVTTAAAGSIVADAGTGNVDMQVDSRLQAAGGAIHVQAGTNVIVGRIKTNANAAVTALGGSISDADADDSTEDITADGLRLSAATTIGDFIGTGKGIETRVTTLAAESAGIVHVNETDNMIIGRVGVVTESVDFGSDTTTVTDATLQGIVTTNADLLLTKGGSLTISQQLNVGTADARILSGATIIQSASGIITADELGIVLNSTAATQNISLGSANNSLGTVAIQNTSDGGDITVFDADGGGLIVGEISSLLTFAATSGVDTNAGNINVTSDGDLTVAQNVNAAHNASAVSTDESVTLISRNGNFTLADNTVISSDENTTAGVFDDITGDKLTIIAGSVSGSGNVNLGNDIEVRTDGGVAKQIVPRPTAFASSGTTNAAAFVTLADALTMRGSLTSVGGEFLGVVNLLFGVNGEENLEVVIDWGVVLLTDLTASGPAGDAILTADPNVFEFTLDDADKTIFYIDEGGKEYLIPHLYAAFDLTVSPNDRNGREVNPGLIGVRFSVAQHESINVWGASTPDVPAFDPLGVPAPYAVTDATGTAVDPTSPALALLSSTDTNPLRQFTQEAAQFPFANLDTTPTGAPLGLAEWEFITGPAPGFLALPPQERPTADIPPAEAQEVSAIISEISGDVEFSAGAASDAAVGTEVYLQIRRQFELDADAEIVIATIKDNTFIANRDSFEDFIRDNPELTDGAGYEVWLITETGGQKIERPIVKFEITGGRPGPATEELPQIFEPYELKELEFEQPIEVRPPDDIGTDGPNTETSQTDPPTDGISSDKTAPVVDGQVPSSRTAPSSNGLADENGAGEELQEPAVKEAVSGILLAGFTKAARWRRLAERRQPGLRRAARVIRKMETHLGHGIDE